MGVGRKRIQNKQRKSTDKMCVKEIELVRKLSPSMNHQEPGEAKQSRVIPVEGCGVSANKND